MNAVEFNKVDIIFGDSPDQALALLDHGEDRSAILASTGQVVGVSNATLGIQAGEICVLMGLSGSGKSTLLRAVNGLNPVTRGAVRVADGDAMVDITQASPAVLRRLRTHRIAMVFQQFALLPWRTVAENVGFGLELRGTPGGERRRVVAEKLALVGLEDWAEKYAHELSGGMQQRVGLARAFATDPDILLMDEPFSALDPLIRNHLQDELLALQQRLRKTIVFVSHDLDEAMKLGTHIAIMESGRIVQYGTPEEIVLKPVNDYVADFVAHMNPLNVLRGSSLMTRLDKLPRDGPEILLDTQGLQRLRLDDDGVITSASASGIPLDLVDCEDGALSEMMRTTRVIVTAPLDITLKIAIQLRHATGHPVILLDSGRAVGILRDREIYDGMLRQSQPVAVD